MQRDRSKSAERPRFPRHRPWLVGVLAAVLIHQLGACPCGCLEHHYWSQLALQIVDSGAADEADEDGRPTWQRHDCVDIPPPFYLAGKSPAAQRPPTKVAAPHAVRSAGLALTMPAGSRRTNTWEMPTSPATTLPVRAQLQVFRL